MAWRVEYDQGAVSDLKKLDRQAQRGILQFKRRRPCRRPSCLRQTAKTREFDLWRYRWQQLRIICQLQNSMLLVLVISVGYRCKVYGE